jgi:hypothetical protein
MEQYWELRLKNGKDFVLHGLQKFRQDLQYLDNS